MKNKLIITSIIIFVLLLFSINVINKNHKPEKIQLYTIYSLPSYDSMGNVTITSKIIDHEPTHQDSIEIGFMFK